MSSIRACSYQRVRDMYQTGVLVSFQVFKFGDSIVIPSEPVHLTQSELHGLKFIVMYLHNLAASKKSVPFLLPDPIAVVKGVRDVVVAHRNDCPDKAVTGKHILR